MCRAPPPPQPKHNTHTPHEQSTVLQQNVPAARSLSQTSLAMSHPNLVASTEAAVRSALQGMDASHDFAHIDRVRRVALSLAAGEGVTDAATLLVVELGALLHDVADWKYSGSDTASGESAARILAAAGAEAPLAARVQAVIAGVGFSSELLTGSSGGPLPLEVALVQDADRLDAIGAIGIARCFTYGGAKRRPLHDPAVPPLNDAALRSGGYRDPHRVNTTINHFHEKLLTLKGRMKTRAGARLAEGRHAFLETFLEQFVGEWDAAR